MIKNMSIIAAVALNGVIGKGSEIPWKLHSDLMHFVRRTTGSTVIVGRKTHESILRKLGHPLTDRTTIVLTGNRDYRSEGCIIANFFENAITDPEIRKEFFIIGGYEVYKKAMPLASKMYITRVYAEPEGDIFFPEYDKNKWQIQIYEFRRAGGRDQYDFAFQKLVRIN